MPRKHAPAPKTAPKTLFAALGGHAGLKAALLGSTSLTSLALLGAGFATAHTAVAAEDTSLAHKLKTALLELASRELYRSRDIEVAGFNSGDLAGVRVAAKVDLVEPGDPLLSDPHRRAFNEASEAEGQPVTWALTGGGLYPTAGFGTSVPIGPAASVTAGFNARSSIGYSVLAPYPRAPEAAVELARNMTVELPLGRDKALAMPRGGEVVLRGTGTVVTYAGVGAGWTLSELGGVGTLGATAGLDTSVSADAEVALRVKRLDGDRVFVSLNRVERAGASVGVHAGAGLDAHLSEELSRLGGGLFRDGAELIGGKIDAQLERWLSIKLAAAHSVSSSETELRSYVLDLSKAGPAGAYRDLLQLDARAADQLYLRGPGTGVRAAVLEERVAASSSSISAHLGPLEILSYISGRTESHGTLSSTRGDYRWDRASLDTAYSDALSRHWLGERKIARELVSVAAPGEAERNYYHVRYTVKDDGHTSRADLDRFVRLARFLGAGSDSTLDRAGRRELAEKLKKTDRTVDVYITDAGLRRVAEASEAELQAAFSKAYETLDRPWNIHYLFGNDRIWRISPWLNTASPSHGAVIALLEEDWANRASGSDRNGRREAEDQYRYLTGRNLEQDQEAYREVKGLIALLHRLTEAATPAARAHLFAEASDQLGPDFWRELSTVAEIAGPSEILVNELSIQDHRHGRSVVFEREGKIVDPREAIDAILADP